MSKRARDASQTEEVMDELRRTFANMPPPTDAQRKLVAQRAAARRRKEQAIAAHARGQTKSSSTAARAAPRPFTSPAWMASSKGRIAGRPPTRSVPAST